jgi:hypothetical protein
MVGDGQLIQPGHLKWLLDASFKLFRWAKVQTQNIDAFPDDQLPRDQRDHWRARFDFHQHPGTAPSSFFLSFKSDYRFIIRYLTTQHKGRYLTVAEFEEFMALADPLDYEIKQIQDKWQSCCNGLWAIQRNYDRSKTPTFILQRTSNLPIDINMVTVAEQPGSSRNRVSKQVWKQRIGLPLCQGDD